MTQRLPFPNGYFEIYQPTTKEQMARALVLITRVQAENFDRSLPGFMKGDTWLIYPDHQRESNRHALACYAASRFTADFCEFADQFEAELGRQHRPQSHDRDVEELAIFEQAEWYDEVDEQFAEALAREMTRRGLPSVTIKVATRQ